ncbi:MAG: hypothetical protein HZB57_05835 [Gammaproteobacteria bacterium]|nr:hypothetical protein [Gammaproteobacteria bacterium]
MKQTVDYMAFHKEMLLAYETYLSMKDKKAIGALLCLISIQGEAHSGQRLYSIARYLVERNADIRTPITHDSAVDLKYGKKWCQPWYPTELTWILIIKWMLHGISVPLENDKSMWSLMRAAMKTAKEGYSLSIGTLPGFMGAISAAWRAKGFDSVFIKNYKCVSETVGMTPAVRSKIFHSVKLPESTVSYDDVVSQLGCIDDKSLRRNNAYERMKQETSADLGKRYRRVPDWEVVEREGGSILPYLVKWGEYLFTSGRRRDMQRKGDGLLKTTVHAYIAEFAHYVMRYLKGREFADLDEEDLEKLYVDALNERKEQKNKYHENAVRRLRDFHIYLVEHCDFPVIDISAHFEAWGSLRPRVEWYSEDDIARILHAIDHLEQISERTRRVLRLFVIIGVRLGLRPGETAGLELDDLRYLVAGIEPRLAVRINHLGRLKTNNARRDMPLRILLSSEEYLELSSWVNDRRCVEAAGGNASLWFDGHPRDVNELTDNVRIALNLLLKAVTGDEKARLYGLRHTFANNTLSLIFSRHPWFERNRYDNIDKVLSRWENHAEVVESLVGRGASPTASLEALAHLMGHASPSTTLRWYVHCVEWLASMQLRSMQLTIPKEYALTGLNVPQSTWYHWSGKAGSTPSYVNTKCLEYYCQREDALRETHCAQPAGMNTADAVADVGAGPVPEGAP